MFSNLPVAQTLIMLKLTLADPFLFPLGGDHVFGRFKWASIIGLHHLVSGMTPLQGGCPNLALPGEPCFFCSSVAELHGHGGRQAMYAYM